MKEKTSKYEKMVDGNLARSKYMVENAISIIQDQLEREEEVTVAGLQRKTGYSRGFFYNNARVSQALEHARDQQKGKDLKGSKRIILQKSMEVSLKAKDKEIRKLKQELETIKKEKEAEKKKHEREKRNFIYLRELSREK